MDARAHGEAAGQVAHHVDATARLHGFADGLAEAVRIEQVGLQRQVAAADFRQRCVMAVQQHHARTRLRKGVRDRAPQVAACAGDQYVLAVEVHLRAPAPWRRALS
ncbi:hypothetical protein D3C72_897690 [compost metagenome]